MLYSYTQSYLMRFFERIEGTRTAAPRRVPPVIQIPLQENSQHSWTSGNTVEKVVLRERQQETRKARERKKKKKAVGRELCKESRFNTVISRELVCHNDKVVPAKRRSCFTYHAAPTTDTPMVAPAPKHAEHNELTDVHNTTLSIQANYC